MRSSTDGVDVASRASAPGCSTWTYALPSRRAVDARSVVARIRECVANSPARDALGARRVDRARARALDGTVGRRARRRARRKRPGDDARDEKPRRECGDMCRRATLFAAPRRMRALERVVTGADDARDVRASRDARRATPRRNERSRRGEKSRASASAPWRGATKRAGSGRDTASATSRRR